MRAHGAARAHPTRPNTGRPPAPQTLPRALYQLPTQALAPRAPASPRSVKHPPRHVVPASPYVRSGHWRMAAALHVRPLNPSRQGHCPVNCGGEYREGTCLAGPAVPWHRGLRPRSPVSTQGPGRADGLQSRCAPRNKGSHSEPSSEVEAPNGPVEGSEPHREGEWVQSDFGQRGGETEAGAQAPFPTEGPRGPPPPIPGCTGGRGSCEGHRHTAHSPDR